MLLKWIVMDFIVEIPEYWFSIIFYSCQRLKQFPITYGESLSLKWESLYYKQIMPTPRVDSSLNDKSVRIIICS